MSTQTTSVIVTTPVFRHSANAIFGETSVTYERTNDQHVEMAVLHPSLINEHPELILAIGTREQFHAEDYPQFTYSLEEIKVLKRLLNSPEVTGLIGE